MTRTIHMELKSPKSRQPLCSRIVPEIPLLMENQNYHRQRRCRTALWRVVHTFTLTLLLQQALITHAQTTPADIAPLSWRACNSDKQLSMCGAIPLTKEYRAVRRACCRQHRPIKLPATAQATVATASVQQAAITAQITRGDLTGSEYLTAPNYLIGQTGCPTALTASIPRFSVASGATFTTVTVQNIAVPRLTKATIQKVKSAIIAGSSLSSSSKTYYNSIRRVNTVNGATFNHPGSGAGAAELSLMRQRLLSNTAVQLAALDSLINGTGVRPKTRVTSWGTWAPPTDCKPTGYYGPLPMASVQIRYSGINAPGVTCPVNYPSTAPQNICGHVSFVELDGQMAYKMAMAFHATGDTGYSDKVIEIINSWVSTNTKWGWWWENGPLEAGWGVAAMARALELIRHRIPSSMNTLIPRFTTWVMGPPYKDNIIYNMEYFLNLTKVQNRPNTIGNWHSTLAETYMAVGVLSDNITTYNRGVGIFQTTVTDYLKWGKGAFATNRVLGECSETLRDMYHSQFGLGGLLQAAEIAWQQDDASLYAYDNFALAAAMEFHARLTNAFLNSKSTTMLPQNFRYYDSNTFPKPPTNCTWRFNTETQLWSAYWTSSGAYAGVDLRDGFKYLLGFGFLPTGWELGYNHYAGRLGISMPETAALLARSWPEWQEFHWGLGTLGHAQSATALWRSALTRANLCSTRRSRTRTAAAAAATTEGPTDRNDHDDDGSDHDEDLAATAGLAASSTSTSLESPGGTSEPDSSSSLAVPDGLDEDNATELVVPASISSPNVGVITESAATVGA